LFLQLGRGRQGRFAAGIDRVNADAEVGGELRRGKRLERIARPFLADVVLAVA